MSTSTCDSNTPAREIEELEDRPDIALMELARAEQANEESVPAEIVRRLVAGEQPVTVWRDHRHVSIPELAGASGVSPELIVAIEAGKDDVSLRSMQAIARSLQVDPDDLVPWSQE